MIISMDEKLFCPIRSAAAERRVHAKETLHQESLSCSRFEEVLADEMLGVLGVEETNPLSVVASTSEARALWRCRLGA